MKNKDGTVIFNESSWKILSREAKDLTERMVAKNPADRISAKDALKHPWFSMEHNGAVGLSTAQENMRKYNDKNRFNMEKIKPEFSIVTCSPLLAARGANGVNSPAIGSRKNQFIAQSPMPTPSRLVKNNNEPEESKVMKGGVVIRNLFNKPMPLPSPVPNIKSPCKKSSFKKAELNAEKDPDDDSGEINENDIDEQSPDNKNAPEEKKGFNQAFIPRLTETRKLPQAPGFHNTNAFNYLKTVATPMQYRRQLPRPVPKTAGLPTQKESSPQSSYFKRLAEASKKAEVCNTEENAIIPKLPDRNDPEFQTAISHNEDEEKKIEKFSDAVQAVTKELGDTKTTTNSNGSENENAQPKVVQKTKNILKEII